MKKTKKYFNLVLIFIIILIIGVLCFFICKNLFYTNDSDRLSEIEKYVLTSEEINLVKEQFAEVEQIKSIDVFSNYKIIKIMIELESDVDFDIIKEISNKVTSKFSEDNLKYYDIEIFVNTLNKESEIYPKIGYKHKMNSDFTWNR